MTAITITAAPGPRLRLTKRGRTVLVTLAAAPLAFTAFWFALNGGGATATLESSTGFSDGTVATVMVQPGDTLWSIAETVAPASDPRDVIIELMQFNGLTTADVPAGFELAIPPQY